MRYLLDTNIISALMRERDGVIARKLEEVGEENVFTSGIEEGELWFGAVRKGSERLIAEVRGLFERLAVEPVSSAASQTYGELRAALERAGTPIGPNDLWIAAHALAGDATLVTDNEREFGRVPGLRVENWLRAPVTGAIKTESGRDDG